MEWLTDPQLWAAFFALAVLEIVLGIDNIVFISILAGRLPESQRHRARQVGLLLALGTRLLLLLSITWVMGLTAPLFNVAGHDVSGRDLILIGGGVFLLWKAVHEIHHKLEGAEQDPLAVAKQAAFGAVVAQIVVVDVVFSLDSVITAIGMTNQLPVMVAAVVVSIGVMLAFAGHIADFVERHPTVKMLALAFLVLIGANLVAEGLGHHIPKGFTYFAMAFSVAVEMLNLRAKRVGEAVKLKGSGPPKA